MPLLIKSLDPFDPESRTVERIPKNRRIAALCPKTNLPVVCIYNGTPLLRAGWKRRVKHGDTVAFVVLPRGKAVKSILSIVVMAVVSFYVSPIVAGKLGFAAGSFGAAMVTAGLSIVTSLLLSAILPPPKPPTPQSMADIAAPSPTYNLAAQGNAARLEQPIPVHYGRHIAYPDFAARPYQEYQDNEQYLYQLLVVGQGLYDIESIRIEDTPIATFEGAQTEIVQPGQTVTLFPSAVIQSSEIGGAEITGPQGPFTASGPDESATVIGVDLVCPAGLYYSNDAGGLDAKSLTVRVEAQKISNEGTAVGAWIVLGTETISGATNTAIRRSYRYAVAAGRYQVRVTRTDTKDTRARAAHAVHWAGLRAYLPDATDYGNITLLAVKLKATAQISEQATRRINIVGTRKLPTWHPTNGWSSPVATRSIAWALADICRASYGASLSDDRYDLAGLYALDQVWTARGDTFDARFDGKMTIGEALSNTARAGRAKWYQQAGKVGFWRDTPQTVPRYIFQPRNIAAGSFSMDFAPASTDTSDAVRMSYFDERYWQQRDATCMLAGSAGAKLAEINAFGMIKREQVVREGMYIAAANRYRRRFVKFETEMDGHLVRFGDLIGIAHDVPAWGQSGDLIGWDAATRTATLSEPPVWTDGANHYVRLVGHNGTPTGIIQAAKHATQPDRIILAVDPGFTPETEGYRRERTRYVFGSAGQIEAQALVVAIRPKDRTRIEIEAVVEDSRVHDAETGTVPDDTAPGYPSQPTAPVVTGLIVSEAGTPTAPQQIVSWQPAEGAKHYLVEYTTDDINWIKAGDTTGSRWTIDGIAPGQYFNARVAAMGLLRGPWVYQSGISGASVAAPGGIVDLALAAPFTGPECSIRWSAVPRASRYRVRVYAAGQLRRETSITGTRYTYTVADAAQDGGPWRSLELRVLPLGIVAGDTEAAISATNPNVGQLNNVQVAGTPLGIQWSADAPSDPDLSRYLVWASTTPGFTASSSNLVYAGVGNVAIIKLAPNQRYYIRCAAHDVWGTDGLNISGELQAETGTIDFADVAGQIESPQLADSLLAPINAVPGIASAIDWDAETAKINRLGAVALVKSERVHTFASITVEQTERSSATDALAQQITTLQAQVASGDSTNSAAIQAEQTARASGDAANAASINNVQARLDTGDFAAVKTSAAATASAVGSIQAKWSVQTQAMADGKKAVAGIEVIADGGAQESAIRLLADKFIVYKPDGTGAKQVFTLGTVNGQTTLILLGDLLADGTIAARHLSAESVTADKLSVNDLSAISANLGNITAGRVRSSDNAVDLDLNNKYLRVLDNAGSERVKLGLLEAGKYGLRVRDPATNKTATLTPNAGMVIAQGQVWMPTTLNADGSYDVEILLPGTFSYADLTVLVDADDVPNFDINCSWQSAITGWGANFNPVYSQAFFNGHLSPTGVYRERDSSNTADNRPKYKAHTISNIGREYCCTVATFVNSRWNRGNTTSSDRVRIQVTKHIQAFDRNAGAVKSLIEIGWPVLATFTVIARNYQG